MNRKVLALAVSAALSPLAAQAEVTLYGKLTLGVESVRAAGATLDNQSIARRARVTDSFSTIGFKGSEEISEDLQAIWQIETQIKPDDACGFAGCSTQGVYRLGRPLDDRYESLTSPHTGSVKLANRPSFVGLKGSLGQIAFGRFDMYYDKHVPSELHLLRSGLSSTGLAILGSNSNSNAAGISEGPLYAQTFTALLGVQVAAVAAGSGAANPGGTAINSTAGTLAVAKAMADAAGPAYAAGKTANESLAIAGQAATDAVKLNFAKGLLTTTDLTNFNTVVGGKPALLAQVGLAANSLFNNPDADITKDAITLARTLNLQNAFYNVGHRNNNVVQYRTPSLGGLTVVAAYSAGERTGEKSVAYALDVDPVATYIKNAKIKTKATGEIGMASSHDKERQLDPWLAELTFHYLQGNTFASFSTLVENDPYSMGGVLDRAMGFKGSLGVQVARGTRLGGVVERQINKYNAALGFDDNKRDTWLLSVSQRFNPQWEVFATYGQALDATLHGQKDSESGAKYWQATGTYSFSKSTNLFATYAKVTNEANAAYNFYVTGAVQPDGSVQSAQGTPRGSDPESIQLGINHTF